MADYNSLKATIDANIRANGVQAITGPVLNACLKAMITVLGNGYQLQGSIAQPGDDPSVPDARVAYLASGPGTYTDFGGVVIPDDGHAYMLTWDTQWTAVQLPVPTWAALSALATVVAGKQDQLTFDPSPVSGSLNPVTSGGIFSAIESAKGAVGLAEALLDTDSAGAEQEFALRPSGGDGGAYFRRLLGNTKAFNQLVENGNFSDGATGWSTAGVTVAMQGAALRATATATSSRCIYRSINIPAGHATLLIMDIKRGQATSADARFYLRKASDYTYDTYTFAAFSSTDRIRLATIITPTGNIDQIRIYGATSGAEGDIVDFYNVMAIDLAAMQDNSTTPEEFREKYPLLYYAYGRKLIHNKVAKVITKGANQWDEVWELGGYRYADGQKYAINDRIRSANPIKAFPNTEYYANVSYVFFYDANMAYLGYQAIGGSRLFTTPANCAFVQFVKDSTTTYNNDICINLSNADINGTYFPYWKRELALDITNQEDTNGNKPFADGAKSCPAASDEWNEAGGVVRVGTRAYQAGDESDASVITDGVDTAYALTTPVPFTWKEPLNTGIKVSKYGTEEVTPAQTENIDCAPFRAVTTYTISIATLVAALHGMGFRGAKNNPEPEPEEPKEEIPEIPVEEPLTR